MVPWYLPRLWEERRRELDDQHERAAREDRGEDRMCDPCGCAAPTALAQGESCEMGQAAGGQAATAGSGHTHMGACIRA